jgi:hypothetical protein
MKIITVILALLLSGCYTSEIRFNDEYQGDDFMLSYEYGGTHVYEDLIGKYWLVLSKEQYTLNGSREEIIHGGPYKNEVECLLDLHHSHSPDNGFKCIILK